MRNGHIAVLSTIVFLIASAVSAAAEPVPVLLRFPSKTELPGPGGRAPSLLMLVIGDWASRSLNKENAEKMARFNAWLPDADLESKARAAFACAHIAAPDEACRTEAQLPKNEDEFVELLRSGSTRRGFIVTIQPIMAPAGLFLRVPVKEVEWDGQKLKALRTLTALYASRVPQSIETQKGVTEEQFKQFWQSGAPSRLSIEADKGVKEAARLFEVLAANIGPDESIPQPWRDLPKIATLEKAGRARCAGMPSAGVRIYRDTPDGLWLTFASGALVAGHLIPDVGAAMVSLDPDAALFQTNVWTLTYGGYY